MFFRKNTKRFTVHVKKASIQQVLKFLGTKRTTPIAIILTDDLIYFGKSLHRLWVSNGLKEKLFLSWSVDIGTTRIICKKGKISFHLATVPMTQPLVIDFLFS